MTLRATHSGLARLKPHHALIAAGVLSVALYLAALAHGAFRPGRIEAFFPIFGGAFVCYALASWRLLRPDAAQIEGAHLRWIFAFALLFNAILLFSPPTLSDDMYRYVWDGRVQGQGINPYRYPSNAPQLAHLRDDAIYRNMNRPSAVTIYPPFAQTVFAVTWRIFGDSVIGFKVVFIGAVFLAAGLLVLLLRHLGESPTRIIVFVWHPLLVFEIAHAAHVDALYLPLIVGAFVLRATAPTDRVSGWHEIGIGVLLGLATLTKLYPAFLMVPLWSVRAADGRRHWRWLLPISMAATIALGYLLYSAPDVNLLGFLSSYSREFFNVSPLLRAYIDVARQFRIPWHQAVTPAMFGLVGLLSVWFWLFPARTAREAILRCTWLIGVYLAVNINLFSWYVVWLLPLAAITLRFGRLDAAFAWWTFSALIALSYTFFIDWEFLDWALAVQYYPLYVLLLIAFGLRLRAVFLRWRRKKVSRA